MSIADLLVPNPYDLFGKTITVTNVVTNTINGIVAPTGVNTGDVTLAAFGSTANTNGASLNGQVLTLQPASTGYGGGVSTGAQTFNGIKTFQSGIEVQPGSVVGSSTTLNAYRYYDMGLPSWNEGSTLKGTCGVSLEIIGNLLIVNLRGLPDNNTQYGGNFSCLDLIPLQFRPSVNQVGSLLVINGSASGRSAPNTVQTGAIQIVTNGQIYVGLGIGSDGVLLPFGSGGITGDGNGFLGATCTFYMN